MIRIDKKHQMCYNERKRKNDDMEDVMQQVKSYYAVNDLAPKDDKTTVYFKKVGEKNQTALRSLKTERSM